MRSTTIFFSYIVFLLISCWDSTTEIMLNTCDTFYTGNLLQDHVIRMIKKAYNKIVHKDLVNYW
jgi:hypothetical protein